MSKIGWKIGILRKLEYAPDALLCSSCSKCCFTQVFKLYTKGEPTKLKDSQGVAYTTWTVLGNGQYRRSIDGIPYGDIYSEKCLQRWIASELGRRGLLLDDRESRIQWEEERINSYGGIYTHKSSAKSLGEPLNTTEEIRLKVRNARKEYMNSFHRSHGDKESAEMMELRFQARREKGLEAREERLKMTEDPSRSHIHGPSAQLIKDELIKDGKDYVKPIAFMEKSDSPKPSTKPLRLGREEFNHIFDGETNADGSKKPLSKTNIGDGLQDMVRDTTIATGPGAEHDSINSLTFEYSAGEVLIKLFRQSSRTEARRWSFKMPLWAFGLGECLLEGGKTRVRWRCVCGRQMYDDFIELRPGAAAEFENRLNNSIRKHAIPGASNPSQDDTSRSSTSSSARISEQQQTAGSDISLQPSSWTASTMPDSNKNAALTIDVYLEKCWLLICGQTKRGPDSLLAQLDLSSKPSDKDLFDSIKKFHSSLRSTFTLRPVLKGVQTIRFVQASFEH